MGQAPSPPRARSATRRRPAAPSSHGRPGVASHEHTSGGDRARCGREWGHQKTVLLNPGSPRVSLPLVGLCTRTELLEVARGADVPVVLRITANELAERRPPLLARTRTRSAARRRPSGCCSRWGLGRGFRVSGGEPFADESDRRLEVAGDERCGDAEHAVAGALEDAVPVRVEVGAMQMIGDAPWQEPSADGRPAHRCRQTGAAQSVRALCDVWPAAGLGGEEAVMRSRRASLSKASSGSLSA
jgi:hypothetical protein